MTTTAIWSKSYSRKTLILQNPPQIWLGSPGQGLLHSESAVTRSSGAESPHQHSLPAEISFVWWSQFLDFRLQTSNHSTVHACQGMTSNQAEHSTVVGTVKGQRCHFFTWFVSYMPYLVRDLFHSRWPWTRTGNVLCQESRTHCPFQSENDIDNWHWCKQWLDDRQQDKQAYEVQIQLFHASTNGLQGPRK